MNKNKHYEYNKRKNNKKGISYAKRVLFERRKNSRENGN